MRTEIANLSNDWRRDRMRYCVHAPEMLLVVERGEHDAADPEGATADGPVVAVVLAEVGQVRVDGDEAAQDPGLDARQAPVVAARRQEARQVADGVAPLALSDQGPQVGT